MKESDYWMTPKNLYPENCFDPCPVNPNFDGLSISWHGKVFCNPPYSEIKEWVEKAIFESKNCESITMLLPNWTDREWFQTIQMMGYEVNFLRGRLKFLDPKTGKPGKFNPRFGSMLVYIR